VEFTYSFQDETLRVTVAPRGDAFQVTIGERTYAVSVAADPGRPGEVALTIDGRRVRAWVAAEGGARWVALDGQADRALALAVPRPGGRARRAGQAGHDALEAQMPGVVRRVLVAAGDAVERGQALLLLEAMKIEMRVTAPHAGVVEQVSVQEGQAVERGQLLVSLANRG
jgi:biotin carboxyl carrier protein